MDTPISARLLLLAAALLLCAGAARSGGLWMNDGRPTADAVQAVTLLASAADDGLDPQDYNADALQQAVRRAHTQPLSDPALAQRLDAALSQALLRYAGDRRNGRIDPRRLGARFDPPPQRWQPTLDWLTDAVRSQRLAQALQQTTPYLPMYDPLRQALARYRALDRHPAWSQRLPPLPVHGVRPGQAYAGLAQVARRLQALGDLATDTATEPTLDGALLLALERFQSRHGLAVDGVLGPATLQQLEVPPARRARQIELAMERLRWTPYLQDERMIVVNLPEFVLRAYEVHERHIRVRLTMKVIIGNALDTRTPLISEPLRAIEFSPYWNVPLTIARAELVPRLLHDPAYFRQQGFEFVGPAGQVVTTLSPELLKATFAGSWRLRQRPGPLNALGDIKFIFPNDEHIFLHHTPATQLFRNVRRDFSHGCIRVEDPVALAGFVLQAQPGWDRARIEAAMAQRRSSLLQLDRPLPVLITYITTLVKGGQLYVFPDLYGQDRLLDQALRQRSADLAAAGFLPSQSQ